VPPADKLPLTVAIIALNAASQIEALLASVPFADEILVVDSGSKDATAAIAGRFGARVVQKEWLGFGKQKQFAVSGARNDWVLCLDVDERVTPELAKSIREAIGNPRFKAYRMPRRNRFLGTWLAHGEGYPDWTLRLFDRREANWSNDPVHETVLTTLQVGSRRCPRTSGGPSSCRRASSSSSASCTRSRPRLAATRCTPRRSSTRACAPAIGGFS